MGIHRVAFQAAEIMLKYIIVASVVCAAVVCALDTEKPPMKPKPPMEPKDSASLIDDMLDEHATLNEDLDAKQRTEMHDLSEHHDSNNDNYRCSNRDARKDRAFRCAAWHRGLRSGWRVHRACRQ